MDGFATTIVNTGGSIYSEVKSWADNADNKASFTNGGYAVTYGRSVHTGDITLANHVAATSTWKLTANSKSVTTTVTTAASVADVLNALYD